jgi:uncharacterized coiled-coil DUF342 family protein
MKKLSKEQEKRRDELVNKVEEKTTELNEKIDELNEKIDEFNAELSDAYNELNEAIDELNSFREEVQSDMQNYYDERSDKWREGEAGEQYQEWINVWENISIDQLDVPEVNELDQVDTDDFRQEVIDLPASPDEC